MLRRYKKTTLLILLIASIFLTSLLLKTFFEKKVFSLSHNGLKREYLIHLPNNKLAPNLPLVIVLHGGGSNAESIEQITSFNDLADINNFIVVYPQGYGPRVLGKTIGTWNSGTCCPPAIKNDSDDVGFIKTLIDKLKKDYLVDSTKIYVTGFSNGAQMSYRILCELSEEITAIAPVGATAPFSGLNNCVPKKLIPILHLHGDSDPCALPQGGTCGGCFSKISEVVGLNSSPHLWECEDIKSYNEKWAKLYNLDLRLTNSSQKNNLDCTNYNNKSNETIITSCLINNNGHTWPGGNYGPTCNKPSSEICKITKEVLGPLNPNVNLTNLIWDFFKNQ